MPASLCCGDGDAQSIACNPRDIGLANIPPRFLQSQQSQTPGCRSRTPPCPSQQSCEVASAAIEAIESFQSQILSGDPHSLLGSQNQTVLGAGPTKVRRNQCTMALNRHCISIDSSSPERKTLPGRCVIGRKRRPKPRRRPRATS